MIGTTRRINEESKTIDWVRLPSNGQKQPDADQKESVIYRLFPEKEATKLIFQMGTSDPDRAVEAAKLVAADVAGIDVNAGCPKPFSTLGGMGAALLRTPDKLCAILEALVQNVSQQYEIGISVKIRLLETAEQTEALVRRLVATGITGLTVHCRTTPMRPRERAIRGQLRMIAEVCHEAGVACLMNGDIETREQGLKLAEEFGTDGAMIATAAEKNPSCFRSKEAGGPLPWHDAVAEYVKMAMSVNNRWGNTKFLLSQMVPGKSRMYQATVQAKNYTQACQALELDGLLEEAGEVDSRMGLNQLSTKPSRRGKNNSSALAAGGQTGKDRPEKSARKSLSERSSVSQKPPAPEAVALTG